MFKSQLPLSNHQLKGEPRLYNESRLVNYGKIVNGKIRGLVN
jgi:hypothetical protein